MRALSCRLLAVWGPSRALTAMKSWVRAIVTVSGLALALSGCGLKGSLENPPEAKAEATADAQSGQGKSENGAPKPHKPFVLDGLIR